MFAVIIVILIIWAVMWAFYKFMYPRPPKSMMPQKGDVVTPRTCEFCGNSLAEYRGVLETKPTSVTTNTAQPSAGSMETAGNMETDSNVLFFCNYEHQADYHAGKVYDPNA